MITKTRIKSLRVAQTHNFSIFPSYCTITHRVMKLIKSEIKKPRHISDTNQHSISQKHCAMLHINLLQYKYRRLKLLVYVHVFLLLFMYPYYYVYVFLLLCMLCSVPSVSLCCSVYCLCVNVYRYCCHRVSTKLQLTNISYHNHYTCSLH